MPRPRPDDEEPPDRLTAVLEEFDEVRTRPTWTPREDDIGQTRGWWRERLFRRADDDRDPTAGRHLAGAHDDEVIRPHTPLIRAPESLRDSRVAPSRLALVGVLALLVVAAVILGGRVLVARATAAPHAVPSGSAATTAGSARHTSGARPSSTAPISTTPAVVVVQVVGQVRHPGVVTLHQGARVQDAVKAAGGATSSADLTRVNLARKIVDGEQIHVPKPGEVVTPPPAAQGAATDTSEGADGDGGEIVDLNTAPAETLEALPGIGPVLASRIVDWRQQNGRFSSVDELAEVSGIGDKMLAQLRPHVRV